MIGEDPGSPLLASLDARVEAALVAAQRPVRINELQVLLPEGTDVEGALSRIEEFWLGRGAALFRGPDGVSLRARRELAPPPPGVAPRRLSDEAMATLAVIAMHQPATVAQIEKVRNVKLARGMVEGLVASGLVEEIERRRGTGRAKVYGTTLAFLRATGLAALSDMPTPEEVIHTDVVEA